VTRASDAGSAVWVVYSDGASRGNPGPASLGAVVYDPAGVERRRVSEAIGRTTNNVAEYRGLLAGLEAALELGARRVEVRMDSELVVKQATGTYRVRNPGLLPLHERLGELRRRFEHVAFRHVPRELNRVADSLANQALDGPARPATPALVSTIPSGNADRYVRDWLMRITSESGAPPLSPPAMGFLEDVLTEAFANRRGEDWPVGELGPSSSNAFTNAEIVAVLDGPVREHVLSLLHLGGGADISQIQLIHVLEAIHLRWSRIWPFCRGGA
jgi:ribonuclease HI